MFHEDCCGSLNSNTFFLRCELTDFVLTVLTQRELLVEGTQVELGNSHA